MLRWLATLLIVSLFVVNLWLPHSSIGRRGSSSEVRVDVVPSLGQIDEALPDAELVDLEGRVVRLSDLRGHRVLLTFERSVDW